FSKIDMAAKPLPLLHCFFNARLRSCFNISLLIAYPRTFIAWDMFSFHHPASHSTKTFLARQLAQINSDQLSCGSMFNAATSISSSHGHGSWEVFLTIS